MMILVFIVSNVVIVEATSNENVNAKHIGVIIVADPDFKTNDFYRFAKNKLNPNKNPGYIIESGNKVQNQYMEYWAEKGFLSEQPLTEQDMIDFVKMSGYDNVIYLIPLNFSSNDEILYSKNFLEFLLLGAGSRKTNISMAFAAVLCDENEVIKKYNTIEELTNYASLNMDTHGKNEYKYDIFRQCVRKFGQELNL